MNKLLDLFIFLPFTSISFYRFLHLPHLLYLALAKPSTTKGYGSQHYLQKIQMMHEKKPLMTKAKRLEHYWQIYLKHLIDKVTIY